MKLAQLLVLIIVSGCAFEGAKTRMYASESAYRSCVNKSTNLSKCEKQRRLYEIDKAEVDTMRSQIAAFEKDDADKPRAWLQNNSGHTSLCNNYGGMVNCN